MMSTERGDVLVLAEKESAEALELIDEMCKMSGDTFSHDPTIQEIYTEPIAYKVRGRCDERVKLSKWDDGG